MTEPFAYSVDASWSSGTSRRWHAAHPNSPIWNVLVAACNESLVLNEHEYYEVRGAPLGSLCRTKQCTKAFGLVKVAK